MDPAGESPVQGSNAQRQAEASRAMPHTTAAAADNGVGRVAGVAGAESGLEEVTPGMERALVALLSKMVAQQGNE